jgi:formamidopyrimidine-DNA glycosylase
MPELPEVETVRSQLATAVVGDAVVGVSVPYPKVLQGETPAAFAEAMVNTTFLVARRRAKVLLLDFSNGMTLLVHLKMTGRFLLTDAHPERRKETEVIFLLASGRVLAFDDVRHFGWIKMRRTEDVPRYLAEEGYGPEPLDPLFSVDAFAARLLLHSGKRIKQALLDQTCIAGVGNIYADESLWESGIAPIRRVHRLRTADVVALHRAIRLILSRAVADGGSSANDYLDIFGRKGNFFPKLQVYGKAGTVCAKGDGGILRKRLLGGRGTHWCPVHQR